MTAREANALSPAFAVELSHQLRHQLHPELRPG
jgi:hypothetical protein